MLFNKEELEKIRVAKKKWEEEVVQKSLKRFEAKESPNKYYTPADLPEDFDFLGKVGFPGQYPFTTGRYPFIQTESVWGKGSKSGVSTKLKRAGRYSGFGTPEDTRDHYTEMREKGFRVGGPNLAFDLPTQTGRDSDDELSEGEVGRVGVSVDTLRDFEVIYEAFTGDMELDKIASNFTINGATNIMIAMYCALAEKRGVPLSALRGTPQNDILKEFVSRGTQIFPVKPSMRMTKDTMTFCVEQMPRFNITSICGYHMREFGATRTQAIAFTIANAIAYYQLGIDAGIDVDKLTRQMTWLSFGGSMEVLKEYAVRRAAKSVWAKVMRERFNSPDPRNWIYRELGGVLQGYWTATKQRPLNNLTRTVIGGVFSAMQGDQPLLVEPPYDEALGLGHSLEAQQLNEDASRIILEECKLAEVLDPFAGSYYIESLTDQYEKEIWEIIEKIDAMGGAAAAVESGWMKDEIMRSSYEYQKEVDAGREVRVGMSKYTDAKELVVTTPRTLPYDLEKKKAAEEKQVEKLKKVKKERDNEKVQACLKRIKEAARDESVNLIPLFIEAVKEYTSEGEICGALREVFGEAM